MTEYRRYQGKSYMVWRQEAKAAGYEYPMVTENRIPGLLPLWISNADTDMQFWYEISGKYTIEDWMKMKKTSGCFLRKFMTSLAETIEQIGEYLLCEDGITLSPERIFVDAEEKEIMFCYMPFEKISFADALCSFMEYYLSHMEHGNRDEIQKCYEVYEKCQQKHVTMEELLEILYEDKRSEKEIKIEKAEEEIQEKKVSKTKPKEKKRSAFSWKKKIFPAKKKPVPDVSYVFEPEEDQKESASPTVFLGSEGRQILGELKYEGLGNGKNFSVTTPVFLIGSQENEVDGLICDGTISRIHARIIKEEERYYLEDMNSTNGTYRNGEALNYGERIMLEKNDRISFAQENYRFV